MVDWVRQSSRAGRFAGIVATATVVAIVAVIAAPAGAVSARTACGKAFKSRASTSAVKVQTMTAAGTRCRDAVTLVRAWSSSGKRPGCIQDHGSPGSCKAMGYACINRYASLAPGTSPTAYAWVRYRAACSKGKRSVQFTVLVATLRLITFGDPADLISKFVFDLAKEPLKNFLMAQVGLPSTSSQLKAISAQISALSSQLAKAEANITAQVAELKFELKVKDLFGIARRLTTLNTKYFRPTVQAIIAVKDAEATGGQAAIESAKANFRTDQKAFLDNANAIDVAALAGDIHDLLQPALGKGLLRDYGTNILAEHRIVNTSDSDLVYALYSYAEENQALATWMDVEGEIAVGTPESKALVPGTLADFTGWTVSQRDGGLRNGLHAGIPRGVAIDRGPDQAAANYTTVNKPEFAYFKPTDLTWAPFAFSPPSGDTVPNAVNVANSEKLRGMQGWSVPSGGQLYGLFDPLKKRGKDEIVKYLRGVLVDEGLTAGDWLWDTDSVQQRYCVQSKTGGVNCNHFTTAHRGLSTTSLSNDIHPQFEYVKASTLDDRYKAAKGGLMVVRDTGQAQFLP